MVLTEEQRRQMVRDAGAPKKGHHWTMWFDRDKPPELIQQKTQFASVDGSLVCHRVTSKLYKIVDRDTAFVLRTVERRDHAKRGIEELGPNWANTVRLILDGKVDAAQYVTSVFEKIILPAD